jgi:hypothetical protein
MRQIFGGLSVVVLVWGCGANGLPLSQTSPSVTSVPPAAATIELPPNGNWTPWFFPQWQPGIGAPLAPGQVVDAIVDNHDVCVESLRQVWDARASCKRFVLSAPSDGRLDVYLRWDTSAPGFVPSLSGDVVIVAPNGRFATSDWTHTEEHVYVLLRRGDYGVLVMNYVPASLPFQIRAELHPQ